MGLEEFGKSLALRHGTIVHHHQKVVVGILALAQAASHIALRVGAVEILHQAAEESTPVVEGLVLRPPGRVAAVTVNVVEGALETTTFRAGVSFTFTFPPALSPLTFPAIAFSLTFLLPASRIKTFAFTKALSSITFAAFPRPLWVTTSLAHVVGLLAALGPLVTPGVAITAVPLELPLATALHRVQVTVVALRTWVLVLRFFCFCRVHVHVVLALPSAPLPLLPNGDLLEGILPRGVEGLEAAVLLQVVLQLLRKHALQRSPLRNLRKLPALNLHQLPHVLLPLCQCRQSILIALHWLGVMHPVGQLLEPDSTLRSHLPRQLVPRSEASSRNLFPQILHHLQRVVLAHQGEDRVELVVEPDKVGPHTGPGILLLLLLHVNEARLFLQVLDPVKHRLAIVVGAQELLHLELKVREVLLLAIVMRNLVERLVVGEVLAEAAVERLAAT